MLTTDVDDPSACPYFTWDRPTTNADIRATLAHGTEADRLAWMARILREARVPDVWHYLTLRDDVLPNWPRLQSQLGRRRALWEYLLAEWQANGLV